MGFKLESKIRRGSGCFLLASLPLILLAWRIDWPALFGPPHQNQCRLVQFLVFVSLASLLCVLLARFLHPRSDPVFRDLARYGDLEEVLRELEADISEAGSRFSNWELGKQWLVCSPLVRLHDLARSFSPLVLPLKEIVSVTQGPTRDDEGSLSCVVRLRLDSGRDYSWSVGPGVAERFLQTLKHNAPWVEQKPFRDWHRRQETKKSPSPICLSPDSEPAPNSGLTEEWHGP